MGLKCARRLFSSVWSLEGSVPTIQVGNPLHRRSMSLRGGEYDEELRLAHLRIHSEPERGRPGVARFVTGSNLR